MMTGTSLLNDRALSKWIGSSCYAFLMLAVLLLPIAGRAQDQASSASAPLLKPEQLDALVAPVALYPDDLLSLVLMASTYPLEVVEADRWVKANKNLKGDQLKAAVDKQGWDDSVKSLVATPEALAMMSSKLDWTQNLGDAVLAQQPDVMDAIQRMRTKAEANNKLASTKQQKVSRKDDGGKQVIVIESAAPETVYVPYYDPAVVYGAWPYPAYPPYYFPPPGYIAGEVVRTGIAFGVGFAVGRWTSGGCCWGGGFGWGGNNININRAANINVNVRNWQHDAGHRHGVRYTNANVQQKFGNTHIRNGAQNRMDFRGRDGSQILRPDGARANLGDRAGGAGAHRPDGNRAGGAGQRRPEAGNRPARASSAAHRPNARPAAAAAAHRNGNALGNISSGGRAAHAQSMRGHASLGGGGPHISRGGGRGGGGFHGGGGRGGRRSDMALKHDIVLLAHLPNGIGFYRFSYNGSNKAYVGVIAQEVELVAPDAVVRGPDGYLRVYYERIGIRFQTYRQWIASSARVPDAGNAADR